MRIKNNFNIDLLIYKELNSMQFENLQQTDIFIVNRRIVNFE